MKNKGALNLFKLAAVFFTMTASLTFCACTKGQDAPRTNSQEKPQILTSSYVPYTLVKNIIKDKADISMLMPPGVEPHSFEPLPKDILKVAKAPFFFYVDRKLEPWAYEIKKDKALALAKGITNNSYTHLWMDFDKAFLMTKNATYDLQKFYPELEPYLNANLIVFEKEINKLKEAYTNGLKNCRFRDIYHIGHLAFEELAQNYKLNFKPLVNSSESQEPSPKDILEMIKQIKERNIKYIFTEEALPPEMAALIAAQTNTQILMLYTIEHITKEEFDRQITYQDFMYKNLENLKIGLECK
ncbi:MAG: zinc ABC transporter substrate-binding protein [Elusimicrobiaceae bacterium]|nr:zinc ABC transporter substrate-binding protein [Elusimicrobiaceae bacterium]